MPRLFTGVEIADGIRDDLAGLEMPIGGARWVDWDDYHVTLRFAGEVDPKLSRDWRRYLEDINADAFQMKIKGVGVFTEKDPRTLWAGVEAGPGLEVLARANEAAARHAGLPPPSRLALSRRSFRPHITLARLRNPPVERVARFLEKYGTFESEPFVVTHFSLFSARPGGGGPYVVEEEFPLLGGLSRAGDAKGWMQGV